MIVSKTARASLLPSLPDHNRSRERDRRDNDLRSILSAEVDNVLALVQILDLSINVGREIRAGIHESLNSEQKRFASLEMDTHGPKRNIELDYLSLGYLFFLVVGMVRDQRSAPCRVLSAVRSSQNAGRSRVLIDGSVR